MSHLALTFLGTFQIRIDEQPVNSLRSTKARCLLAYLVLEANRPHQRSSLVALLWPDDDPHFGTKSLRQALYVLRQSIEDANREQPLLLADRQTVQINDMSDHSVDVNDFLRHMKMRRYASAVDLYQGDLLAGIDSESPVFDEWLVAKREELHQLALNGYQQIGETALAQGDPVGAAGAARRELVMEPWREGAHIRLMRALLAGGDRMGALAQFDRCQEVLMRELNAQPSSETRALYEEILHLDKSVKVTRPERAMSGTGGLEQSSPLVDLPETAAFYGRKGEQKQLEQWIVHEDARLVSILGLGGIGKTSLVAHAIRICLNQSFDIVIWKSLLNAPSLTELLSGIMNDLTGDDVAAHSATVDQRISRLMNQFRANRCLLVLDNLESILVSGDQGDQSNVFMTDYQEYGQLLQAIARHDHQSCVVLTSREQPQSIVQLEADLPHVRSLRLQGVDVEAADALLNERGVATDTATRIGLMERYSGNPLALKLAAEIVGEYFAGDLAAFLEEEMLIVDDVRKLLDEQFSRLKPMEHDVMVWLAMQRVPMTLQDLRTRLVRRGSMSMLVEAARALVRRSLVEQDGSRLYLQNVITEYVTDYLVQKLVTEIETSRPELLTDVGLLDTKAPDYVQQSQKRILLRPVLGQLTGIFGQQDTVRRLLQMIEQLRIEPLPIQGYGPGNVLNLLVLAQANLRGQDLSALSLRHVDLSDTVLPAANLAGSDVRDALFAQTFNHLICLDYSPDGQWLAAGSFGTNIYVFDTNTWQIAYVLGGHRNWVFTLSFTPDGAFLVSGSHDGTVRLWETTTFSQVSVGTGVDTEIHHVSVHPDRPLFVSLGDKRVYRLWGYESGELVELRTMERGTSRAVWHPDGQRLLFGNESTDENELVIYDVVQDQQVGVLAPHDAGWDNIAVSSDGIYAAASGPNNVLNLWDLRTLELLHSFPAVNGYISRIHFARDNRQIVASSVNQLVRVWDLASRRLQHTFTVHVSPVLGLALHPLRDEVASSANDHSLAISDLHTFEGLHLLRGYAGLVASVAFSPDGSRIAAGNFWGTLSIWNTEDRSLALTLPHIHPRGIWSVAYSPDGSMLATASGFGDGVVHLWHTESGQLVRDLQIGNTGTDSLTFSPAGSLLAAGGADGVIRILQVNTGELTTTLVGHTNVHVYGVRFSQDGQMLASACDDDSVRLWSTHTGEQLALFSGHKGWTRSVDFHPQRPILASCSDDRTIRLWSVPDGEQLAELRGHEAQVRWLKFLPNQDLLISASYDHTLRLWDSTTGEVLRVFAGHTGFVMSVDVSPDGRLGVSGGFDETVRIWEIETGACLAVLRHERPYEQMNIAGISGLTPYQIAILKELGAVEEF